MNILGLSCFYHDAAAASCRMARSWRRRRRSGSRASSTTPSFPTHAVAYCLREGGITAADLDAVAFYDKPFLTFERLLETYLAYAPARARVVHQGDAGVAEEEALDPGPPRTASWITTGRSSSPSTTRATPRARSSRRPFERAAVLTADGVGEWATTSYGVGEGNRLRLLAELHFPHSLGLLYSAFTYFCGFQVNSGEYKLMGLAPYGEPRYADTIRAN